MFAAQAQLADAYIATGAVAEARFIAEDLVAREPWERTNIERFRRTLEMLGEPDPDGVIAERLSGESPFMSTDLLGFDAAEEEAAAHPDGLSPELLAMLEEAEGSSDFHGVAPRPVESSTDPVVSVAGLDDLTLPGAEHLELHESSVVDAVAELTVSDVVDEESEQAPAPPKRRSHFELSTNAIDLDSILGDSLDQEPETEPEAAAPIPMPSKRKPKANAEQENVEVDLSIDLDGINADRQPAPVPTPRTGSKAPAPEPEPPHQENDLDSVFAQLRSEASRRSTGDGAEEQMKHGIALREAGKLDKALQAFEVASRSPRHRFQASVYAARIYRERDQLAKAIEWFERATQAPAPTTDDGFELLYELADALEATGESARALAVCLEILADAGDFRDVKARADRLSKAQA